MAKLPPIPTGVPPGHSYWNAWYEQLRRLVNSTLLNHNDLQNIQGGSSTERYHLTSAQNTSITSAAGTVWTPTLTNTTNVAASTAYASSYVRYGNSVFGSGRVDIDPTAAGDTVLELSLPVASAFTNEYDLNGGAYSRVPGETAECYANTTNDRAVLRFTAVSTANNTWRFWFAYRIL